VKVKRCTIVLELVLEVDNDSVSPVGFDERAGHLTVYEKAHTFDSIGCNGRVCDFEGVLNGAASLGRNLVAIVVNGVTAEVVGVVARLAIAGNAEIGLLRLGCASSCRGWFVLDSGAWERVMAGTWDCWYARVC
jgi:hypothetical protein